MNVELRRQAMTANDEKLIYRARNLVCNGSNFFDTGFAPFTSDNINKDFKITIRLSSIIQDNQQNVILGCKYEGTLNGLSYPGFYMRIERNSQTKIEIGGYNYYTPNISDLLSKNIFFWRKNGVYKCYIDGLTEQTLSVRSTQFDQNIVIGAGVQTNGTKFRYSNCTIDYIRIEQLTSEVV